MRYFNTEGICRPEEHYMVRLDERLEKIKRFYVDRGKYFVINRGRQYGKTTTLRALEEYLRQDYLVFSMDFQMLSTEDFKDEQTFIGAFIGQMKDIYSEKTVLQEGIDGEVFERLFSLKGQSGFSLKSAFSGFSEVCKTALKPVVLMIDEVDSASNNQVFIDFLAQMRGYYLKREAKPIFHSVILAGVYDIKNLKSKIRPEEEHQYNSPWNIAAVFDVAMEFSAEQIAGMLFMYETDHQTGMDIQAVAEEIYRYTSGYPYLVSAVCKYLDEDLESRAIPAQGWTQEGIEEAVKALLISGIPLFGSMMRHLGEYPDLRKMLYAMLFRGEQISYNPDNKAIELACMFGYAVNDSGKVRVANRIFETRLYNFFLSEDELENAMSKEARRDRNQLVLDGRLDMKLVLRKFAEHFTDIYGDNDERFVEAYGRKFFLLYLRPIINGTGNYYIEAQTRDERRTDVIVDYLGKQYVVELKIWHGNEYNERGEKQLAEYLDYYHLDKGYLISFNFNKKKEAGVKEIRVNGKAIVEVVV